MRNIFRTGLTAALAGASLLATAKDAQVGSGETGGYKLVWQDLFDAESVNTDRWNVEVNGTGMGNNELQYYTDRSSNVCITTDEEGNSALTLTAIRESYGGKSFTSGRINSKNKIAFTHGKVEASIKLPSTANGLWPAFWMMGNDYDRVGWPSCGEIDIMEFGHVDGINAGTQDRFFNGACHWYPDACYSLSTTYSSSLQDGQYHLWTLIWTPEAINMYVDLDKNPDAAPYFSMQIPSSSDTSAPGYYFHKDNFILFNLAVGGDFPAIYDANAITALNSANNNSASMLVNYVKVYQLGTDDENQTFADAGDSLSEEEENTEEKTEEEALSGYLLSDAGLSPILAKGDDAYSFIIFQMNDSAIATLEADGKQVTDYRVNNSDRNLWWWNGWSLWEDSTPGPDNHTEGYVSIMTNDAAASSWWSGGGFNIGSGNGGADFSSVNLETTRLHASFRSTNATSVGLLLFEGQDGAASSTKAEVSLGSAEFNGNPIVGDFASDGAWRALDISLAELASLSPSFSFQCLSDWCGNTFGMNTGATAGITLAVDHIYLYTPKTGTSRLANLSAKETGFYFDRQTVTCSEPADISVYDLSGRLVASANNASSLNLSGLAAGLYVIVAGSKVLKISL